MAQVSQEISEDSSKQKSGFKHNNYTNISQRQMNRSQQSKHRSIKTVKDINGFDRFHYLSDLPASIVPDHKLGEGSYRSVYGVDYTIEAVLKVFDLSNMSQDQIKSIRARANIALLNPSTHTVNIYNIKEKEKEKQKRMCITLQKCHHTLKVQLNNQSKNNYPTKMMYIDQIIRGVMHYHSVGLALGSLKINKIYILVSGKTNILKIPLSFCIKPFENKQFIYDMKLLGLVIIKILWNEDFDGKIYYPKTNIDLSLEHQKQLIELINQAIRGDINCNDFHIMYNKIYKAKEKEEVPNQEQINSLIEKFEISEAIQTICSQFIDACGENDVKKQEEKKNLISQVNNEAVVNDFLKVVESILNEK